MEHQEVWDIVQLVVVPHREMENGTVEERQVRNFGDNALQGDKEVAVSGTAAKMEADKSVRDREQDIVPGWAIGGAALTSRAKSIMK